MSEMDSHTQSVQTPEDLTSWFAQLSETVCNRLAENQRVRRTLPAEGRLRIDRQLPFLCVYRQPENRVDTGTRDLIIGEAAYLFASGNAELHSHLESLCQRVAATLAEHFGTFLLLEVWSLPEADLHSSNGTTKEASWPSRPVPMHYEIQAVDPAIIPATLEAFTDALHEINLLARTPEVVIRQKRVIAPPGLPALNLLDQHPALSGLVHIGLGVEPIYRDPITGDLFPVVLRALRQQVAFAIRKAVAAFTGDVHRGDPVAESKHQRLPTDYLVLGQSAFVRATSVVDQQLAEISEAFDFLLQVTPVNTAEAWTEFQQSGFRTPPQLYYRPLPYYPHLMKRRLFELPIEHVEDATLGLLFWEKQAELDRQLTALQDLNTELFRHGSLQLYGAPDPGLRMLAEQVLETLPAPESSERPAAGADTVSQLAQQEIDRYHRLNPEFHARVEINDTIAAGVMVVHNRLLISRTVRVPGDQLPALLHHEVGTHVLTYCNGQSQSLHQMHAGLAGYEELQEGLAVLAEFLAGGLTAKRMRALASRVLAAHSMLSGDGFVRTFAYLREQCLLTERAAFTTTVRAYRGGGFTKDIIYLRGLRELLDYLRQGFKIEPLYVGKIALRHVPIIQELRRRSILQPPALLPLFLKGARAHTRLEQCRGLTVVDLARNSL